MDTNDLILEIVKEVKEDVKVIKDTMMTKVECLSIRENKTWSAKKITAVSSLIAAILTGLLAIFKLFIVK